MRKRSLAREAALKIFYQAEITRRSIQLSAELFWSEKEETDEVIKSFCDFLTQGVEQNFSAIDEKLAKHATNWQLKRMAVIDRNILRMGVFELLFAPDIPPKVTINEAIELAKRYGDVDSSKFVNGVLDQVARQCRVHEANARKK